MRGHWRRLIAQLVIGAVMLAINYISSDLYIALVSITLLILPVFVWTVFFVLLWLSRRAPDIRSLSDRVDDMLTLGLASTVAALIAITVLLRIVGIITQPVGSIITVGLGFVVVAVAIPAVTQLRTVRDVWLPMVMGQRDLPRDEDGEDSGAA